MNIDLKIIKKKYGEEMSKLCRELFPSLLEEEGLLSTLIMDNFNESYFLYNDIVENSLQNAFKNYIYSLSHKEISKPLFVTETPEELMDKVGYILYKCETEEDIQSFKKYYAKGEELCTFKGNRLEKNYVFFAVKKNVDSIRRKDFLNPKRQDEYGTSVISIQFARDESNTLSIKNRYNHTVPNQDATFSNDLENIIAGLEDSFDKTYGLRQQHKSDSFEIPNYVRANDGKYYKYNYEINNIYYCPNNIIIDNFKVKKYEKEKYVILDYFILDLVNKKMTLYDNRLKDCFTDGFGNIDKIVIENSKDIKSKKITITNKDGSQAYITLDEKGRMQSYCNNAIKDVVSNFLTYNKYLKEISLPNVLEIGDNFLYCNVVIRSVWLPNVQKIGNSFLAYNRDLQELSLPCVIEIMGDFLYDNRSLHKISLPNVIEIGNRFLYGNNALREISLPKTQKIGESFLFYNKNLQVILLPSALEIGHKFLYYNIVMQSIFLPKVQKIGNGFLFVNEKLKEISMASVIEIGDDCLAHNKELQEIFLPNASIIGNNFLYNNRVMQKIFIPCIQSMGKCVLLHNRNLKEFISFINQNGSFEDVRGCIKR